MTESLLLRGTLEIGAGVCVSACASGDRSTRALALRCASGSPYQSVIETAAAIRIATAGIVGAAWDDLEILSDLVAIEFLLLKTDQPMLIRIGADEPSLTGSGGVFPTLFAGGETLVVNFDGTAVTTTFDVADQTAAQCVARINAACALAGLPTPRASVRTDGQIQLEGIGTGPESSLAVTSGTGAAAIGFGGTPSSVGEGEDVPVNGTLLCEFGTSGATPAPPARIQASGTGGLSIVAAGRTSA